MKVLISVDIEGVAGVVMDKHTDIEHPSFQRFIRVMTAEANAAVEGALEGGAQEVLVSDSHGDMAELIFEEMNANVQLITGGPRPLGMMQGIGHDVDKVFFIGYHGAAGSRAAVLDHTCYLYFTDVSLNGIPVGEIGLNAALAGSFGSPVVLVTGDQAAAAEARNLLGSIETVVVKEGITRNAAKCLHPQIARNLIKQAASRAVRIDSEPFIIKPPITMRICFTQTKYADMAELIPASIRIDGRTIDWVGDTMEQVYRVFRAMGNLASTV